MTAAPFEVGGQTYTVGRLKVRDSLRGLKLVGKTVAPAIAAAAPSIVAAIRAAKGSIGDPFKSLNVEGVLQAVDGLDCLPDLLDLFVPVTKFVGPTGSQVDFNSAFVEAHFAGRPDLCVEYLARAVQGEYANFIRESVVNALRELMAKMEQDSSSPPG